MVKLKKQINYMGGNFNNTPPKAEVGSIEWFNALVERHKRLGEFLQLDIERDVDQLKGWGKEMQQNCLDLQKCIVTIGLKAVEDVVDQVPRTEGEE